MKYKESMRGMKSCAALRCLSNRL